MLGTVSTTFGSIPPYNETVLEKIAHEIRMGTTFYFSPPSSPLLQAGYTPPSDEQISVFNNILNKMRLNFANKKLTAQDRANLEEIHGIQRSLMDMLTAASEYGTITNTDEETV